jgi:nitrile hydratase beta subunit
VNGVHDMGGMQDFGPVSREIDEPVFHEPWEGRVMALSRACQRAGFYKLDEMRHAVERLPPALYLGSSYYARWTMAITGLLIEKGVLSAADLDGIAPVALLPMNPPPHSAPPAQAPRRRARFSPGDRVVVRNFHPTGHTRVPRYARGKRGVIVLDEGVHHLPDSRVAGDGEQPQHVYAVRFDARELWGEAATARGFVHLDLWEDYLKPQPPARPAAKPRRTKARTQPAKTRSRR